ncbi:hypothetical protein [Streptomyces shenzhenensis]|uniref:hypothetical protein n=1 Tax=Streptomyces shenzhenensis TaxID=943815 RepID=UPI00217D1BB2|nr:hypothetical protein [Streptomyces shenzhenensis]
MVLLQAATRFRDGATSHEPRYDTPALRAVLHHLAALRTPAAGDPAASKCVDVAADDTGGNGAAV